MKTYYQLISKFKNQRGVTAVVVAIVIAVLMGFVALAVDIGYVAATKNELQNAADAAALAGAWLLGQIYSDMAYEDQQSYDCKTASPSNDCAAIKLQAKGVVGGIVGDPLKNRVAGKVDMVINDADISIFDMADPAVAGNIKYGDKGPIIEPDITTHPDAVRVRVHRESGGVNGPITTFFARIFGINTVDVKADATAALTGMSISEPGEVELPVGLSIDRFDGEDWCGDIIKFAPTTDPDACSGWTQFDDHQPTPKPVADILDGNIQSPIILGGETWFDFKGGVVANLFDNMLSAYQRDHTDDMDTPDDPNDDYKKAYNVAYLFKIGDSPLNPALDGDGFPVTLPLNDNGTPDDHSDDFLDNNNIPSDFDYPSGYFAVDWQTTPVMIPLRDNQGNLDLDKDGNLQQETYPDGSPRYERRWETTVLVYDSSDCNPNTSYRIAGFANVMVYDVHEMPEKTISARIMCDYTKLSRGGGGSFGIKGAIPGLVE